MPDVVLTLVMPTDIAQQMEDLLLEHPELVSGFCVSVVEGHGSSVQLVGPGELVSGHSPRVQIQTVGDPERLQALLSVIRGEYPHANIFFWLVPALEVGRIL